MLQPVNAVKDGLGRKVNRAFLGKRGILIVSGVYGVRYRKYVGLQPVRLTPKTKQLFSRVFRRIPYKGNELRLISS